MQTRRTFFKFSAQALGGLSFCSCAMLQAKERSSFVANKTPWPVVVNGKRIKTIDVHAHCYFQEAIDLMGEEAKSVLPPVKGVKEHFIEIKDRIAAMNAQGIDLQVLSINPFWYRQSRDVAKEICRINNEKLSELCRSEPEHFAAFGSLAMQYPDLAVEQLEHAVKVLGLKGAAIGASVLGEDFSAPQFHPVLAKAQELGAVLFIHPQSTPELAKRFKGNGWLSNTIGNPLDTTIALQHLIFEGLFDKFPDLKVLAAHGGGYLGSYGARSDHSCFVSPVNCDPKIVLKKQPSEYLRQIYFDNLVFTSEALQFLASQVGVSQLMIGTDHPIPWEERPVDLVMNTKGFNSKERVQILGLNAAKLLKIN
jgi:aminocarboxymuconate-semialdehyde decarboxylase